MRDSKYKKFGKDGTTDQFLETLEKVAARNSYWDGKPEDKVNILMDAALEAFFEGHPENIQTALQNFKTITFSKIYRDISCSYRDDPAFYFITSTLYKLAEKSDDKLADITLALAKIPAEDRERLLNKALNTAIYKGIGEKSFFSLLLQSGADANARIDGQPGALLVTAVCSGHPTYVAKSIVKLLHDNGASFDDAFTTMDHQNRTANNIKSLKIFQEQIAGKPAAAEAPPSSPVTEEALLKVLEAMQQTQEEMRREIAELRQELTERLPPPAELASQPQKKTYASLNGPGKMIKTSP